MKQVSINITTYNRAKLLPRCLKSVLNQSYKNLEIIIIDDCSTDNTDEVVKWYQKKNKYIKYFKNSKNRGNAFSRNLALKKSSGYYVAFMDDDDEWIDKEKIEKQVKIFKDNDKLGIICSSVRLFSDKNSFIDKIILKPKNLNTVMLKGNIIYSPTVMTKRKIMNELGGFDENLPRGVDSDFCRRCILNYNYKVFFMRDITTNIHQYGRDRMTNIDSLKNIHKSFIAHKIFLKKFWFKLLFNPRALISRIYQVLFLILKFLVLIKKKFLRF
jgi:glycosyltransferase involved in cell wall biosynthesis